MEVPRDAKVPGDKGVTEGGAGKGPARDRADGGAEEADGAEEAPEPDEAREASGAPEAAVGAADADRPDDGGDGDARPVEQATAVLALPADAGENTADDRVAEPPAEDGEAGKSVEQATAVLRLPEAPRDPRVPAAREAGAADDGGDRPAPDAAPRTRDDADASDNGDEGDGPDASDADDADDADDTAVDEPTALFPLPAKPVDQPTTSLRVPDDAPAEPPADRRTTSLRLPEQAPAKPGVSPVQDSGAGGGASSTYVPLKSGDAPAGEPKDPLELLAALTNRPPPPPTPLRTAVRRVKIWTPVVLLLLLVVGVAQFLRPLPEPELRLTAADTYTFDGGTPEVPWPSSGQAHLEVAGIGSFGSSGEQEPTPIASVAKVMTAYIILRDHPITDEARQGAAIPVDEQAEEDSGLSAQNESTVDVRAGDEISEYEAIQSLLIASANNVARLLARWDAGSLDAFVDKMNETARELGMENTTYTDPSGLEDTTVSTAADQVILGEAAMRDPVFREIARQPSYTDMYGDLHYNWNGLVPLNNVVGIKTGTTTAAGGNLLFAVEQPVGGDETRLIVGAVVDQAPLNGSILDGALASSDTLIRFAQEQLRTETILSAGAVVGYVDDGLGGRTPVVVTEDVTAVGWDGMSVDLTLDPAEDGVPGSAAAGTEVGTLTVAGTEVPVALAEDLSEPAVGDRLTRVA